MNKKRLDWQIVLGVILIALSALVYFIHYLIFRDVRHIFIYLIGDIGFAFIEVLLVTLIIHRILGVREKRAMLQKLNMVIGAFFSEVGTTLFKYFAEFDPFFYNFSKKLVVTKDWSEEKFMSAMKRVSDYKCDIDSRKGDLDSLKGFLLAKRNFLLRLLENPNLLEHESFTNLLWAVFHLTEELAFRKNLKSLHEADADHISGDMKRAYLLLVAEWLMYMKHLKSDYPYLFSLAVRTNPFDEKASVEVTA